MLRSALATNKVGRQRQLAGLCLALALGVGLGCREKAAAPKANRLLVVGVDGADPRVVRELVRAGDLPHLSRLIESGSIVPLKTDYGSACPVVWTTMVTGLGPDEHGIRDFDVADGKGTSPVSSGARRRPALWEVLDRVGRRGAFLGLWATWPAETTSGLIVSDRAIYDELERTVHPPERGAALASWRERARGPENPFPEDGVPEQDHLVHLAALEAVADDSFDLVFVRYDSVEVVSHEFWHLFYPKPFRGRPPEALRQSPIRNPVREAYRSLDAAIGELLARAPENLDVVVVSDHGFRAQLGAPLTGGHDDRTPGVLVVSGPRFDRGALLAGVSIQDVAPTLLHALGLPVGSDFIGKPAVRLFARDYRRSYPVREIASWGERAPEEVQASSADEELVERLEALGHGR